MARVKNTMSFRGPGEQQTHEYCIVMTNWADKEASKVLNIDLSTHYVTKVAAQQKAWEIESSAIELRNRAKSLEARMGENAPLPANFAWVENGKVVLARHWAAYGAARMLAKDSNLSTSRYLQISQPEYVIAEVAQLAGELLQAYLAAKDGIK